MKVLSKLIFIVSTQHDASKLYNVAFSCNHNKNQVNIPMVAVDQ